VRIIDRVAAAMRATVDEIVLIANAPDAPEWLPGVRVVRDRRPERGGLVGISTALEAAAGADVLVVAWDMPFVTPALLRTIASRLTPPIAAVVPYVGPRAQGLCAAYAASCRPAADAAIARGDLAVSAFVDELPVVRRLGDAELSAIGDPARLFVNVNSAADLAAAEVLARRE
jgi:molybdopterin-guanine dinucleotide biosynthesis protein A